MTLEEFYRNIPNIDEIGSGEIIQYFVYYYETEESQKYVTPNQISIAYDTLSLVPYSNIAFYLIYNSNVKKGKDAIFMRKDRQGYKLTRKSKEELSRILGVEKPLCITDNLFDIKVISDVPNTPFYLRKIVEQMCGCYNYGLYTACFAMMRKLIETLVIESFERYSIEKDIQNTNGDFFYLSDLIDKYSNSKNWTTSRNLKSSFKNIKKYGDLSVHNRKFFANKTDIDSLKDDLRQSVASFLFNFYSNLDNQLLILFLVLIVLNHPLSYRYQFY